MSLFDYQRSKAIAGQEEPFHALIMAAMRQADSTNIELLKLSFPEVFEELQQRYDAPQGLLRGERTQDGWSVDDNGNLRDPEGEVVRSGY